MKFTTSDGFTVLVGRNNRQNDRLTLKTANNNDIWFHTKNIPGSHTVLVTEGRKPTETAMEEAAQLAAQHSRAKDSAQVRWITPKSATCPSPKGPSRVW